MPLVSPGNNVLATGPAGFRGFISAICSTGLGQVSRPWSFSIWLRFDVQRCASIRWESHSVSRMVSSTISWRILTWLTPIPTYPWTLAVVGFLLCDIQYHFGPTGHQIFTEEDCSGATIKRVRVPENKVCLEWANHNASKTLSGNGEPFRPFSCMILIPLYLMICMAKSPRGEHRRGASLLLMDAA